MGAVVFIRKRSWEKDEPFNEYPSENIAIRHAEALYYKHRLNMVAVVTINPDTKRYEIPYKIQRKCRHTNVQQVWSSTPTLSVITKCIECNEEILPIVMEEKVEAINETGR